MIASQGIGADSLSVLPVCRFGVTYARWPPLINAPLRLHSGGPQPKAPFGERCAGIAREL